MANTMFDPEASLDLDALRARLRAMDDRMLKQWGAAAARLCRPESNLDAPLREVFVIHLREARVASLYGTKPWAGRQSLKFSNLKRSPPPKVAARACARRRRTI
jgi:hypothetical protein